MFDSLTYAEWDALCSRLERAMNRVCATRVLSGGMIGYLDKYAGVMDDLLDVHGALMDMPVLRVIE
jgi:hypothetical protein